MKYLLKQEHLEDLKQLTSDLLIDLISLLCGTRCLDKVLFLGFGERAVFPGWLSLGRSQVQGRRPGTLRTK